MVDQAVLDKLEAGFKKLEASDSKSLLKKYLTRELFDSLKVKKTSYGSTLLDVIQSGTVTYIHIYKYKCVRINRSTHYGRIFIVTTRFGEPRLRHRHLRSRRRGLRRIRPAVRSDHRRLPCWLQEDRCTPSVGLG